MHDKVRACSMHTSWVTKLSNQHTKRKKKQQPPHTAGWSQGVFIIKKHKPVRVHEGGDPPVVRFVKVEKYSYMEWKGRGAKKKRKCRA